MNIHLNGKTALIIGGASPRNKAICRAFEKAGCSVVGHVFEEKEAGGFTETIVANVCQPGEMKTAADHVLKKYHKIDILINSFPEMPNQPFFDISPEEWVSVLDQYTDGPFLSCQAIAPYMEKEKEGVILNISSAAGITGGAAHFAAASSALHSMTKGLAREYREKGIRVAGLAAGGDEDESSIASAAVLLCSEFGKPFVGESILVDGGKSIG